eukprot:m51a1_g6146 hypothetical protein (209) ;mRNA; f:290876-291760
MSEDPAPIPPVVIVEPLGPAPDGDATRPVPAKSVKGAASFSALAPLSQITNSKSMMNLARSMTPGQDNGYRLPVRELGEIFSLVAKDQTSISTSELGQLMKTKELKEIIKEVDIDGNGSIDFDEFVIVMSRKVQSPFAPKDVKWAFGVFRGDMPQGKVKTTDIQKALAAYSKTKKLSPGEAAQLTSALGNPPGGILDYEQFVDIICKG